MFSNVNRGPGPTNPETDFKQAYLFKWPKNTSFTIETSYNTTWVSYIYLFDAATHQVMFEFTNDDGGQNNWNSGINEHDSDLEYGILNYHKINVSPGHESAGDEFFQSSLAKKDIQHFGGNSTITLGFSDGHGRDDNAIAVLQVAYTV